MKITKATIPCIKGVISPCSVWCGTTLYFFKVKFTLCGIQWRSYSAFTQSLLYKPWVLRGTFRGSPQQNLCVPQEKKRFMNSDFLKSQAQQLSTVWDQEAKVSQSFFVIPLIPNPLQHLISLIGSFSLIIDFTSLLRLNGTHLRTTSPTNITGAS